MVKTLGLHVTDPGSIPGTTCGPWSIVGDALKTQISRYVAGICIMVNRDASKCEAEYSPWYLMES